MIKLENVEVVGWEHAIRGMRNPKNSWERSDTCWEYESWRDMTGGKINIGPNDHKLMMTLAAGGPVHAKYRRMITVYVDITAPLYWWKEFDTYKVGTVANSCSTMHKIDDRDLTLDDFSHEHMDDFGHNVLEVIIRYLNNSRQEFKKTEDKDYWWNMIQILPTSYNQKRTVMLSYEVLVNMYRWRKNHKLDEWHVFCDWIESLPYSEIITMAAEFKDTIKVVPLSSGQTSGPKGYVRTEEEIARDREKLEKEKEHG